MKLVKGLGHFEEENKELMKMFEHNSKLSGLINNNWINSYKKLLFLLHEMQGSGEIPVHPNNNYLNDNELAINIYKNKYYLKDIEGNLIEKMPEEVFARLSAFISAVEKDEDKQREWAIRFYNQLYNGYFLPGGRVIAGSGDLYRLKTLANCFVSLIEDDNIESIYKAAYECARTYSYGGGIGVDISVLRPRDSVVHNAADKSTGAVSFMEIYSLTTGLIGQSGRRGALMLTLDVKHPDIFHFIKAKNLPNWVTKQIVEQCKWSGKFNDTQLEEIERQVRENTQVRFANISLKVSDEFMQAVSEENKYGRQKILLYKKHHGITIKELQQGNGLHYSYGMPSKHIEKYELESPFDSIESLNDYLAGNYKSKSISKAEIEDTSKRDIFGDYVIQLKDKKHDLAIKYAGDFMLYFNSEQTGEIKRLVKARDIWDQFVEGNYKTAEPGLVFWTTMTKYSPSNYVGKPISSTNPCGEVPLEDGGACNLGSVNLSRFVKEGYTDKAEIEWDKLHEVTKSLVRFLDNVVTWNEVLNPLEKQRKAASETRRLGLGIMGIADMLNQLGIGYDSREGIELMEKVSKFIANASYSASAELAEEKGCSPIFNYEDYAECPFFKETLDEDVKTRIKKHGLRNIAILSIAPTGTISNIVLGFVNGAKHYIGVSGGIEPIFSMYYTRRSESFGNVFFKVFHSTVQAYIEMHGLSEKVQKAKEEEELVKILPKHFFRTAHYVEPLSRVRIQGITQKYIDHSISSTVNLPEDIEPEVISNIYIDAWKHGLKGITIYRDGSRYPILSVEAKKTEFQIIKNHNYEYVDNDGNVSILKGDSVIKANGVLTTIYHALKKGLMLDRIRAILNGGHKTVSNEEAKEIPEVPANGVNVCINCPEL